MWFLLFGHHTAEQVRRQVTWIEVTPLDVPQLLKKKYKNSNRIVQTTLGEKTDTPPPDAFLGKTNQTVDQQTISIQKKITTGHEKVKNSSKAKAQNLISNLGLEIVPQKSTKNPEVQESLERLTPEWAHQNDVPHDYIKGLKESDRTALNTKEYMFYGYFQRIRQRLDLVWSGTLKEKLVRLYRRGRQLASDMDHITRLVVTLNIHGEIIRVQIIEESGTRDLDDAAVNAFNQAGPFPNPPRGIVDRNGLIQIRWDFVLKT